MGKNRTLYLVLTAAMVYIAGYFICADEISTRIMIIAIAVLPVLFYVYNKPLVYTLKCMLVVMFFIPFDYIRSINIFNAINPATILGTMLCVKIVCRPVVEKRANGLGLTPVDKLYILFFISALISTCSAISILGSLNWVFYSFITGYIAYRVIISLKAGEVRDLLKFLVFAGALCALYGIIEYLLGKSVIYGEFLGRLTSLIGHPLLNGLIFSTVLPISILFYFETKQKRFISSSAILFMAIILTFARGSWAAIAITMLLLSVLRPNAKNSKILLVIFAFFIVLMAIPATREMVIGRLKENERHRYSSFDIRFKSIPVALAVIKDRPFFGGGPFNASRYKGKHSIDLNLRSSSYENTYLELLIDLGYIGFSLLIFIYLFALKRSLFAGPQVIQDGMLRAAISCSLLILLINMATFNFNSYRMFHFITWFYVGLAVKTSQPDRKKWI